MKNILFVCSGNTCRSPMAQAVFNCLAPKYGAAAEAFSAGLYTEDGLPYSENSVSALKEEQIELSGSSKRLTADLLENADMVFGMTASIGAGIMSAFPEYAEKVYKFPTDVSDPFGGDLGRYKIALSEISDGVKAVLKYLKNAENENDA